MIGSQRKAHRRTVEAVARGASPNAAMTENLSRLERLAVRITDRVGTMGFFLIIVTWTLLWTGYNLVASELPLLHLHAFDPFPAFVAYLLISNVIQIVLMPLIMVGQNLQGRHSEARAEADFRVNQEAFAGIKAILSHLDAQDRQALDLARTNQEILRRLAETKGS